MARNPVDDFVWIMAAGATDPRIIHVKTLAVGQPVWLEAHIADAVRPMLCNILPRAMALAAELRAILGAHAGQLLHLSQLDIAFLHARQVIAGRAMALLAGYARQQRLFRHMAANHTVARVTPETHRNLMSPDVAAMCRKRRCCRA